MLVIYYADILNDTRLMSEPGWLEMPEKTPFPFFSTLHLTPGARHSESQELTVCQVPAGMFLLLWLLKLFTFAKT